MNKGKRGEPSPARDQQRHGVKPSEVGCTGIPFHRPKSWPTNRRWTRTSPDFPQSLPHHLKNPAVYSQSSGPYVLSLQSLVLDLLSPVRGVRGPFHSPVWASYGTVHADQLDLKMKYVVKPFPWCLFATLLLLPSLPAHSNPFPQITQLSPHGCLTWTNIIPGEIYAIESAPSPSGGWTNFSTGIISTGATMSVEVPMTSGSAFYRVASIGNGCTNQAGRTFEAPVLLGQGCGDSPSPSQIRTGCGAAFYRVVVWECDASFFVAREVKARFQLLSPPGSNYDLYIFRPDGTEIERSANPPSTPDTVTIANADTIGDDNGFEVVVEIVRESGYDCEPWQLTCEWNPSN